MIVSGEATGERAGASARVIVDQALAKLFDNEWLSPSLQTGITHSIAELSGVADRGRVRLVELYQRWGKPLPGDGQRAAR